MGERGRLFWILSDGKNRRIFLGSNFSIPKFWGVGKFGKYSLGWFDNLKVPACVDRVILFVFFVVTVVVVVVVFGPAGGGLIFSPLILFWGGGGCWKPYGIFWISPQFHHPHNHLKSRVPATLLESSDYYKALYLYNFLAQNHYGKRR